MRTPPYAELARAGRIETIYESADGVRGSRANRMAYKWMWAALEFGHDARERLDDVLQLLDDDDSEHEKAAAHWELGVAYLTGDEGLPIDLGLARRHLELAFVFGDDLATINGNTGELYAAEPVRARVTGNARTILEHELAGGDQYRRLEGRIDRVLRLRQRNVPEEVLDAERDFLREAAETLLSAGPAQGRSLEDLADRMNEALED